MHTAVTQCSSFLYTLVFIPFYLYQYRKIKHIKNDLMTKHTTTQLLTVAEFIKAFEWVLGFFGKLEERSIMKRNGCSSSQRPPSATTCSRQTRGISAQPAHTTGAGPHFSKMRTKVKGRWLFVRKHHHKTLLGCNTLVE